MVSEGRRPNVEDLRLDIIGVALNEKGGIKVNTAMRTSVAGIFAVGDVTMGHMSTNVAYAEGVVAAQNTMGMASQTDYSVVPLCTSTLPELAFFGLTEQQAKEEGYDVRVGSFPFAANAVATTLGQRTGLIKLVADRKYGQILGAHIVGPQASNLIAEAALAAKLEATSTDIASLMHFHPSLSEAVWEVAPRLNRPGDSHGLSEMSTPIRSYRLGRLGYAEAYQLQLSLSRERSEGQIPDCVLFVEHPPTLTMGKSGKIENVRVSQEELKRLGVSFYFSDRGGDVTYHGPGQLVAYPIVDLRERGRDVHAYVHDLEETIIGVLDRFGIASGRARPSWSMGGQPSDRGHWDCSKEMGDDAWHCPQRPAATDVVQSSQPLRNGRCWGDFGGRTRATSCSDVRG